ncbi:MAG TPA: PP2C family protein-serine/threonine phosphatase [Terracidiphilus sp.]
MTCGASTPVTTPTASWAGPIPVSTTPPGSCCVPTSLGLGKATPNTVAWRGTGFRSSCPQTNQPMALYISGIADSYQIFAGGRLIGQFGGLPPHERVLFFDGSGQIMPIPADLASGGGTLTFAIRVWKSPRYMTFSGGGPKAAVRIGDASLLNDWKSLQFKNWLWSESASGILVIGCLLAGIAGLGLYLLRPGEREYLWFSAIELATAALYGTSVYPGFGPAWDRGFITLQGLCILIWGVSLPSFLVSLLKARRGWIYWLATTSVFIGSLSLVLGSVASLSWAWLAALSFPAFFPWHVCVLLLVVLAARRGNQDARLLLGPVGLLCGSAFIGDVLTALRSLGYAWAAAFQYRYFHLFTRPIPVSATNLFDFLVQISIFTILVLRFARTRRDEERQASELEAARTVQRVLIPEEIPSIPGLALECVYKPAGQVGGDFFQILPIPTNGALIVIGDVSGKGMPAAMTVSLLVGTLRTLAHYTQSPGEILAAMNQRMLARSHGGFTTCMVLRCDADGKLTIANAGHIAPYVAGKELPVENGLPLDLAADTTYAESRFQLAPNEQLTLLTDGVVEARDKSGALFGFERSAALSTQPAEAIACAAQAFGQDDDITVLTFSRAGVPAST